MVKDRPPGPEDAFEAALRRYLDGSPIEMTTLAAELGVGRATLYRWVGSREALLGAVLAEMAERTYRKAVREATGEGPERVLAVLELFMRAVLEAAPLKALIEREPRLFIRLATMLGPVEQRGIELVTELLDEEIARGTLRTTVASRTLAQAVVRIADSFTWAHYLGGTEPAVDTALEVVALLLRPPS